MNFTPNRKNRRAMVKFHGGFKPVKKINLRPKTAKNKLQELTEMTEKFGGYTELNQPEVELTQEEKDHAEAIEADQIGVSGLMQEEKEAEAGE